MGVPDENHLEQVVVFFLHHMQGSLSYPRGSNYFCPFSF